MALTSQNTAATWEGSVYCSISQKLQLLQAQSIADMVNFTSAKKLLIYTAGNTKQLGILLSMCIPQQVWPLNSNDAGVHNLHILKTLQTHAVSSLQAMGLKHWCQRVWAAQALELHRMPGVGACSLFNPELWKTLWKKEVDAEWSVSMVSWFSSDRSHLILSQWNIQLLPMV